MRLPGDAFDRLGQAVQLVEFLPGEQGHGIFGGAAFDSKSVQRRRVEIGIAAEDRLDRLTGSPAMLEAHLVRIAVEADYFRNALNRRCRRSIDLRQLGNRQSVSGSRRGFAGRAFDRRPAEIIHHVSQRRKIVQRDILARRDVEILAQLAEQLGLLDAVDAQVGLQVGIQLDDLRRIAGLLDHEINEELFQIGAGGEAGHRRRGGRNRRRRDGRNWRDHGGWQFNCHPDTRRLAAGDDGGGRHRFFGRRFDRRATEIIHHVSERRKIIERDVLARRDVEILAQLAEQLGLLDTVDAQVGLQVGIQLDDLRRIAGLLDNELDKELFQVLAGRKGGCRPSRRNGWRRGRNRRRRDGRNWRVHWGRQCNCHPNKRCFNCHVNKRRLGCCHGGGRRARRRRGGLPHFIATSGRGIKLPNCPPAGRHDGGPLLVGLQGAAAFQQGLAHSKSVPRPAASDCRRRLSRRRSP